MGQGGGTRSYINDPQRSAWEQKDWTRCITYHLDIIISKLLHIFETTFLSVNMWVNVHVNVHVHINHNVTKNNWVQCALVIQNSQ